MIKFLLVLLRINCQRISLSRQVLAPGQSAVARSISRLRQVGIANLSSAAFEASEYVNGSQTMPVHNYFNVQYLGFFGFGNPAQTLSTILDTGSTLLWLPVRGCTRCHFSGKFNPAGSKTYVSYNLSEQIYYGKGYCKGVLGADSVWVSSDEGSRLEARNVTTLFVTEDSEMEGLRSAGIMGLGNDPSVDNLFDRLYKQGDLPSPLFALELSRLGADSVLYYGAIPPSILDNLTYLPVLRSNFWTVLAFDFRFGDKMLSPDRSEALIDSGSSYLILAKAWQPMVEGLFLQQGCARRSGELACPCSAQFPSLRFQAGRLLFQISSSDYMRRESGMCFPSISFQDFGMIVLGDVFLRKYPVLFDKQANRVGFWTPEQARMVGGGWSVGLSLYILLAVVGGLCGARVWGYLQDGLQSRRTFPVLQINGGSSL